MEESRKVILSGAVFLVIVALGLAIYYFLFYEKAKEVSPIQEASKEQPAPLPEEREDVGEEVQPFQVELDKSDELIRRLARELSSNKMLDLCLKSNDLVRRFTAAVDNIANGLSPRPHIDFFILEERFKPLEKNGLYYVDPESYSRYDQVADVFLALDTERTVRFYKQLTPLFQEAYRELGYPEGNFHKTLTRAITEILEVPVVEDDIALKKKVLTYMMVDPELESLSETQKHLFRMGPENIRIIQDKLRSFAVALGIPKDRLPQPRMYSFED